LCIGSVTHTDFSIESDIVIDDKQQKIYLPKLEHLNLRKQVSVAIEDNRSYP
jgi:hypothetical protein